MKQIISVVRSHHERWDGLGYPDGLAGEARAEERADRLARLPVEEGALLLE